MATITKTGYKDSWGSPTCPTCGHTGEHAGMAISREKLSHVGFHLPVHLLDKSMNIRSQPPGQKFSQFRSPEVACLSANLDSVQQS